MADFSNRQLAEIITQTSDKISTNVLKERKIANELAATQDNLVESINILKNQIEDLKTTSIKPDLSEVNGFYEKKTAENIKRLNSRLFVPNLAIYVWLSALVLFVLSATMVWFFVKSKQDIITDYRIELNKEGKIITTQSNDRLLQDMIKWFEKNPKTKEAFVKQR